MKAEE